MQAMASYLNPLNLGKYLPTKKMAPKRNSQDLMHEVFTFEFMSNEYVPIFEKYQQRDQQEEYDYKEVSLNDLEDYYLGQFGVSQQLETLTLIDYTIQPNDTLFGMELRFNISANKILQLNRISEDCLIPGMVNFIILLILHRSSNSQPASPTKYKKKLNSPPNKPPPLSAGTSWTKSCRKAIPKNVSPTPIHRFQVNVYYITSVGNIKGILTINEDIILFDPYINDYNRKIATAQKGQIFPTFSYFHIVQNVLEFQACMNVANITEAQLVQLPMRMKEIGNGCKKDFLVQITMQGVRKSQRMFLKNVKAIVYFRECQEDDDADTLEGTKNIYDYLVEMINLKAQQKEVIDDDKLTTIPYYDQELEQELQLETLILRTNRIWGGSSILPKQASESSILSKDDFTQVYSHFNPTPTHQIVSYIPQIFRTQAWTLAYSNLRNGSSYHTLLHNVANQSPTILIIRDFDDIVFGAYISDHLHLKFSQFFGNGETFLWTLMETNIKVYQWTQKNQDFILCDNDGIAIGCGEKYGLYVNQDLLSGETNYSETFGNDPLNKTGTFNIKQLEIWVADQY